MSRFSDHLNLERQRKLNETVKCKTNIWKLSDLWLISKTTRGRKIFVLGPFSNSHDTAQEQLDSSWNILTYLGIVANLLK